MAQGIDRPTLVTGAAGFIGSHLVQALIARGERVIGLDNFDPFYPREIKYLALARIEDPYSLFKLVEGDCADRLVLARLMQDYKPRGVIHLAAKAGVRPSILDPCAYAQANVLGTAAVLEASHRVGCESIVLASSSSVYGNCTTVPFHEGLDVDEPISPYAATKRACELFAYTHHHLTRQPVACLRFFTVYGPGQRPDLAIASFLGKISRGERVTVYGDGTSSRDYTYVADIVSGVLAAYGRIATHGYRVWNLGNSTPVTLAQTISTIERVVGRQAVIDRRPLQPGDVDQTWADLTRSRVELGYAPATSFERGVEMQWRAACSAGGVAARA